MNGEYTERLHDLAERLPFHMDDEQSVNAAFLRWFHSGNRDDRETLEIWVYCHAQWYALRKLAYDTQATPNDFDRLTTAVFTRLLDGMGTIKKPEQFVHWVNKVSRNAYLNMRKRERPHDELNDHLMGNAAEPTLMSMDRNEVRRVVARAIDRLPPSLTTVARMRFVENESYETIASTAGIPLPTARAYAGKALVRLREDPDVQDLVRDILPDVETPPKRRRDAAEAE